MEITLPSNFNGMPPIQSLYSHPKITVILNTTQQTNLLYYHICLHVPEDHYHKGKTENENQQSVTAHEVAPPKNV